MPFQANYRLFVEKFSKKAEIRNGWGDLFASLVNYTIKRYRIRTALEKQLDPYLTTIVTAIDDPGEAFASGWIGIDPKTDKLSSVQLRWLRTLPYDFAMVILIDTIFHEFTHVRQMLQGQLQYFPKNVVKWKGKKIELPFEGSLSVSNKPLDEHLYKFYKNLPYEVEANNRADAEWQILMDRGYVDIPYNISSVFNLYKEIRLKEKKGFFRNPGELAHMLGEYYLYLMNEGKKNGSQNFTPRELDIYRSCIKASSGSTLQV